MKFRYYEISRQIWAYSCIKEGKVSRTLKTKASGKFQYLSRIKEIYSKKHSMQSSQVNKQIKAKSVMPQL